MKFKFLGTAAAEGVPGMFCVCDTCEKARKSGGKNIRTRSQSLVNDDLLIDFPADTYMHIINHGLELHKIRHCIITHDHSDHFYPNDFFMRAPEKCYLKNEETFNVYGSSTITENLNSNWIITEMEKTHGCFRVVEVKAFESFFAGDYKITPLEADHGAENSLIYIIEKEDKTILYAHDTGIFPEKTWEWIEENKPQINFATFDCCFGKKECRENHMGFDAVLSVINRLKDMGVLNEGSICCVNHFSHNAGILYEEMEKHSSEYGIITSYDGLEIEF